MAQATITDEGLPAPVVTSTDQTVADAQSIPITDLFAVSGSGITEYQVWFSWPEGGDPAFGSVTDNGTPIALDQWVTISSLGGLDFIGSGTPGNDEIWLRAYNGVWSADPQATITDEGIPAPDVSATDQTVADNQSVPLSSMFSVSGNGITEYQVWFGWPEGGDPAFGSVTDNGTPIALDQWVTVSSLSGLDFIGSATPGTDDIWLRAYNGSWSPVAQATITDEGSRRKNCNTRVLTTSPSTMEPTRIPTRCRAWRRRAPIRSKRRSTTALTHKHRRSWRIRTTPTVSPRSATRSRKPKVSASPSWSGR